MKSVLPSAATPWAYRAVFSAAAVDHELPSKASTDPRTPEAPYPPTALISSRIKSGLDNPLAGFGAAPHSSPHCPLSLHIYHPLHTHRESGWSIVCRGTHTLNHPHTAFTETARAWAR